MKADKSVFLLCMLMTSAILSCGGGSGWMRDQAPIGAAMMESDGTLVLTLRAESEGGLVGHYQVRYRPDDSDYDDVLRHLGGMKPGEEKAVPPWPEK
jgi:hypothetical protein